MCENAVKRGVVTGPPTKEKREMEPFGGIHPRKESLCRRREAGLKKFRPEISYAWLVLLYKWRDSGIGGFRTSPSHTFVTVALLTLAFLTFVLDAGKMAASRTATHTVSDLLTKIKQK